MVNGFNHADEKEFEQRARRELRTRQLEGSLVNFIETVGINKLLWLLLAVVLSVVLSGGLLVASVVIAVFS